jgi:peptidoglycan/LPS O-acetylase OafA/YrhL
MFSIYTGWRESARLKRVILCASGFALGSALILLWELRYIAPDWLALIFPFVILAVAESSGVFERLLGSRIAVYWGRVSYSLYMTHNVTLWILKVVLPVRRDGAGVTVFSIYIVSISIVAILTYHFVEEPCRAWMRAQGRHESTCAANAGKDEDAVPRATSN